jgi:hypothetical protein
MSNRHNYAIGIFSTMLELPLLPRAKGRELVDTSGGHDLGEHSRYALLCRHRAAIDGPITLMITLVTLVIAICEGS